MSASEFIAYVGPANIHDSTVVSVVRQGDSARVALRTLDGQSLSVTFHGVASLESQQSEGMFVYALSELTSPKPSLRRFVFANSDEDSTASLEILAEDFTSDALPDATNKA